MYKDRSLCDASFANDPIDRRSVTGFAVLCCGQLISSKSWKQETVTESTCNAEFVGANEALREVVWLKQLLNDMMVKRVN